MSVMEFLDDTIPETSTVEWPCDVCGKEAGPYGGRGRKPTKCADHKPGRSNAPRVTGKDANLAAQAAKSLANMNSMLAMLMAATGMFRSAGALAEYNSDLFETQAHAALLTDPELCRQILKTGAKSAKVSLVLAYGGMAVAVGPVVVDELKEKKAARTVDMEDDE